VRLIKRKQEDGVKITVVTLNPECYPEEKIEEFTFESQGG